jgi:meiotic recombination protein DMC1
MADQIVQDIEQSENESEQDLLEKELISVEKLADFGINQADIAKLKNAGIVTLKAVQQTTLRNLIKIKGVTEQKVEKIKDIAQKQIPQSFITGTAVMERRKCCLRTSTGSKEFDNLLGGGIQTMTITEAFGEFRTGYQKNNPGKTQLAHTLCVTCQLPIDQGGMNSKAVFIDTEGAIYLI